MDTHKEQAGFTIIEVLVSLIVLALFVGFFFQMYLAMESQRVLVLRRSVASDIAYKNLRKFPARPGITMQDCTNSNMDLRTNAISASTGLVLGTQANVTANAYGFIAENTSQLSTASTQRVVAYAPYGCASTIIQVVSSVSFGNEEIRHVSYVK